MHPADWYAEHRVELRLADPVVAVDPAAHRLTTRAGDRLDYDKLLLSTGAEPRSGCRCPDAALAGVRYLRTLDDSDALRAALRPDTRVVIVGGGWIGLETAAAAARTAGASVTVLEQAELPLLRVLGPRLAVRVRRSARRARGTAAHRGRPCRAWAPRPATRPRWARCGSPTAGRSTPTWSWWASGCGRTSSWRRLRGSTWTTASWSTPACAPRTPTSAPPATWPTPTTRCWVGRLRVEHWANALHQPVVAARTMLDQPAVYDRLPYFYTDQYELGMEFTGRPRPGRPASCCGATCGDREFIAFWLREGRLTAAMNVNVWDVGEPLRELIRTGRAVDEALLADPDVPLGQLLGAA